MKQVEIRVRPVIRHVVTRYTQEPTPGTGDRYNASLETLGEFANEEQAERVAEALRSQAPKPMQYVAVERCWGLASNVLYFDLQQEADAFAAMALEKGREFRVYGREATSALTRARHEMGMVPSPCLPQVPPRIEHAPSATDEEKLNDIPNLLRTIAGHIDAGQLAAASGIVSLRLTGKKRPAVFGLGAKIDPHKELKAAASEIDRLAETD